MNQSVLGCVLYALAALGLAATRADVPSRPNIVFILADDLGWGDVGFNGGVISTPNIDQLAREGVQLTQHYVAPVCTPTRAGLLTGRYWTRYGVFFVQATRSLPYDTVTLPRALKTVGYETALVGKWHLGSKPEWGPNHFGFDHSYGSLGGGVGPWDHSYKRGPYAPTWHRDGQLIAEEGHVTDLLGDDDVRWIHARHEAPFFLYAAFTAPHIPLKEPPAWLAKVPGAVVQALQRRFAEQKAIGLPRFATEPRVLSDELARHYAAAIMHLDFAVGRIVDALEKTGKRRSTLIVFTSDNGSPTGVENNDQDYPPGDYPAGPIPGQNRPFRGFKTELYEGGIHVAALANWPGVLSPGRVDQPMHIVDWMPTLTALAGYSAPANLKWDGMNVWPFITRDTTQTRPRLLYTGIQAGSALRDGDLKMLTWPRPGGAPVTELYDLSRDPSESTNLAERDAAKVQALRQKLKSVAQSDRDALASPAEKVPEPGSPATR